MAHDTEQDVPQKAGRGAKSPKAFSTDGSARARVASSGQPSVKARVRRARARGAISSPNGSETRAVAVPRPTRKLEERRPLFVLSTARRRRARYSIRRGGYYSLPGLRKPRALPRPLAWFLGLTGAFALLTLTTIVAAGIGAFLGYEYFAKDLPSVDNIHGIQFQSTRIYDRYGKLLYEMYDPNQGRRTYLAVDQMPQSLKDATIAVEDSSFEQNNGVDPVGIVRALYINFTNKGTSGASTITQQLVRHVLLPEGDEPTLNRKIREAILAIEVSQKYSKDKILELYLNEVYYGSLSYGVAAAADTYFGKKVKDLDLAQSAMLAGLPQAPTQYDPNLNYEMARARQKIVLDLMVKNKYITQQQADAAYTEDVHPVPRAANVPRDAPHFVEYVRQVLEQKYGEEVADRGGLKVFTTIDLNWQAEAQRIATQQIDNIKRQGASNAGLVAINPRTGEILAMVGSVDYTDPHFGQVNVAISLRQPGSSFKPFTYATAFQSGLYNPASILPDLPAQFTNGPNLLPYIPQNYDGRFHGPVSIRLALGNSFNIPAVQMLQLVGVPAVLDTAHRMGITTLNDPERYGLSLTLGGGEVTLLDMTSAFSTFANYGYHVPATPFLKIVDSKGNVLEDLDTEHPKGNQAIDPGVAYEISDILSDNSARSLEFGPNSALKIDGMVAAAKTGTTNDWKDSWTMGYTPALAVGVWVGNNDGRPMSHVAGAIGAAPIWHNFIQDIYSKPELKSLLLKPEETQLPDKFVPPPGMVRAAVCADSGMAPTSACTNVRYEWFTQANLPTTPDTWHRWVPVTLHDGGAHVAGPGVPPDDVIERIYTFPPDQYKGWIGGGPPASTLAISPTVPVPLPTPLKQEPASIADHITPVAGLDTSQAQHPAGLQQPQNLPPIPGLQLSISSPANGQVVEGLVPVMGEAGADNFADYKLEYGAGDGSSGMTTIVSSPARPVAGVLGMWDTTGLTPGSYVLALVLDTTQNDTVRTQIAVQIGVGAPAVTIASPVDNSPVYDGEAVQINALADGKGAPIAGVEIYVDGRRIASILSGSPPWTATWAVTPGAHEFSATAYTAQGQKAQSAVVHVTDMGVRPTPSPTVAPIIWISNLTEYKELKAGVNEVWVDVAPDTPIKHVDIYIDGLPAGFADGPGYRVNPLWTPTATSTMTPPPTGTLEPSAAITATIAAATVQAKQTRVAVASATRAARAQATEAAAAANATATEQSVEATASVVAATTSPTPAPPTNTPLPSATPTFVRYKPLLDPMLGDFVARCQFPPGRHRVTAIGYDQDHQEVGRDETWVVVK